MELTASSYAVVPSAVFEFLERTMPFSELDRTTLEKLSRECLLDHFPKGTLIFKQDVTDITHVHLIQTGGVKVSMTTDEKVVTLKEYGGEGASFGAFSIAARKKAEFDVEAVEDTFCVLIPRETFLFLVEETPRLAAYYDEHISEDMMGVVYSELRTEKVSLRTEGSVHLFNARVVDIVKHQPDVVEASETVQQVGALMAKQGSGSVLVQDPSGKIIGMVTNLDLRTKVVAEGLDYGASVDRIMSSPVKTVPALAFCFEALVTMIQEQVDYLAVEHRKEIVGVINAPDMMVYLGSSPLYLFREISAQRTVEGLYGLSQKVPTLVRSLLESGARAASVTQMLTVFSDNLLNRILTLLMDYVGDPPCSFCWLGLGSEGRREQTFRTDQDNGLVYESLLDPKSRETAQEYFLAFANQAVEHLEKSGNPRCKNNFMSSNPRWCKDFGSWLNCFDEWIVTPMPPDIFLSTIFFDFRPVAGSASLAEDLRTNVLKRAGRYPEFLKYFIKYFLLNEPPVTFYADSVVEKDDAKIELLDLKTRTLTPFVEFARIMSLRHGISETNTLARLQLLADKQHISVDLYTDASQAYEFDIHLALVHQLRMVETGRKPDNFVSPAELSELERKTLQFSFSVIERLMAHVRREFKLTSVQPRGKQSKRAGAGALDGP
jgi:CBS domain-containing protein